MIYIQLQLKALQQVSPLLFIILLKNKALRLDKNNYNPKLKIEFLPKELY